MVKRTLGRGCFGVVGTFTPAGLAIAGVLACAGARVEAAVLLGSAQSFAVLGGSTVTNTGTSNLFGNLGVSSGSAITGFPPGIVWGTTHANDAVAAQAQADSLTAYNTLAGMAPTTDLSGQDLGLLAPLTPGVYRFSSSAQLTGTLRLDGLGQTHPLFVFQIGSTLITASNSSIVMMNGGDPCEVYFQVGSSATLGTGTQFLGTIIALASDTLNTGANVTGHVIALNGAVTLDTNTITLPDCDIPAPGVAMAGAMLLFVRGGRRTRTV